MILNAKKYNKYVTPPIIHVNTISKSINIGVAITEHLKLKALDTISFKKIKNKWYLYKDPDGYLVRMRCERSNNMCINNAHATRVLSKELLNGAEKGHLHVHLVPTFIEMENYYELVKIK